MRHPRRKSLIGAAGVAITLTLTLPGSAQAVPGNGHGNAHGRPADGTVGNADGKSPGGQDSTDPDADANNGYECDHNRGVGRGNPAHSGCEPGGPGGEG